MTGSRTSLPPTLDLYDVACLAGGVPRLSDTVVVALLERDALRLGTTGLLESTGATHASPVEAAVLDAVGPRPRCSAASLRWRVARDPRVVAVLYQLVAAGLLRPRFLALGRDGSRVPTVEGRRVLRQWREDPAWAAGPPDARQVALRGPAAMGDQVLRRSVFGPSASGGPTPLRGRAGRPGRDAGSVAPFAAWGFAGGDGGGWGGGGWGGGDWGGGGGCGGGDGGGGGGC